MLVNKRLGITMSKDSISYIRPLTQINSGFFVFNVLSTYFGLSHSPTSLCCVCCVTDCSAIPAIVPFSLANLDAMSNNCPVRVHNKSPPRPLCAPSSPDMVSFFFFISAPDYISFSFFFFLFSIYSFQLLRVGKKPPLFRLHFIPAGADLLLFLYHLLLFLQYLHCSNYLHHLNPTPESTLSCSSSVSFPYPTIFLYLLSSFFLLLFNFLQ